VGASTGGFTDCLLQRGAARVYAIDVGRGILDQRLRTDSRVVVMEETNARYLERLPETVQFVSIDASFISLKLLLPMVKGWYGPHPNPPPSAASRNADRGRDWDSLPLSGNFAERTGEGPGMGVVALVKPQFEAGRKEVSKGSGVIKDPAVHRRVLLEVLEFVVAQGWGVKGLMASPLRGPKGNVEFLAWLASGAATSTSPAQMVEALLAPPS
jgi:23S rRNA (cytidine1920-2'-O)/16S rRNA (cytidine1409-2'-O)-methyltransferase